MSAERSKTLDRGLRLLELLAQPNRGDGLTISELATGLAAGRPVVYRLVATLEDHGLVSRAGSRVRLGIGLHRLAGAVVPALHERVRPILRTLAEATGATAHLTVVEGDEAVALVVVEPTWPDYHVSYREGVRHALERGAAGRAILAAREGEAEFAVSTGDLQLGAHGAALAATRAPDSTSQNDCSSPEDAVVQPDSPRIAKQLSPRRGNGGSFEASVGIVSLGEIDLDAVAAAVRTAAAAVAAVLA